MKTRLALMLAVVAGTAAVANAQQPQVDATVSYTLNWVNSVTNDQTPLSPGQSANLSLTATMTPASGTVVNVSQAIIAAGQGTLRGIQSMFLDLVGANNAAGTWTNLAIDGAWDLGIPGAEGTSANAGANLLNVQAGQFPFTQNSVNTTNPVIGFWTGTWTPSSYANRTVSFTTASGTANPSPFAANVIVRNGTLTTVFTGTAGNGFTTANIPVIPAPSSLALLGLGGLVAARRRR
jgi:hypothetical protein